MGGFGSGWEIPAQRPGRPETSRECCWSPHRAWSTRASAERSCLVLDHEPAGALGPRAQPADGRAGRRDPRQVARPGEKAQPAVIFSGGPGLTGCGDRARARTAAGRPGRLAPRARGDRNQSTCPWLPRTNPSSLGGARLFSGYAGLVADANSTRSWTRERGSASTPLEERSSDRRTRTALARRVEAPRGEIGLLATYPPHPS